MTQEEAVDQAGPMILRWLREMCPDLGDCTIVLAVGSDKMVSVVGNGDRDVAMDLVISAFFRLKSGRVGRAWHEGDPS